MNKRIKLLFTVICAPVNAKSIGSKNIHKILKMLLTGFLFTIHPCLSQKNAATNPEDTIAKGPVFRNIRVITTTIFVYSI